MQPDESKQQILDDFGDALRDIVSIVGGAYPAAYRFVQDHHDAAVARDHYPLERRAMIEDRFAALPSRYPHIRSVPSLNKKDTSGYYRLSYNRSVLTQSKTEGLLSLPRDADHRRTLATTPQLALGLFAPESQARAEDADAVYGVVVHGPDEADCSRMAFIGIQIPDAAGKTILAHINLFHLWDEGHGPVAFPTVPIIPAAPRLKIVARQVEQEPGG